MAGTVPGTFLLFVAGEPDRGDDSVVSRTRFNRFSGFLPAPGAGSQQPPGPLEPPWHLPLEQRRCLAMVGSLAEPLHRAVKVVDVNRPEGDRELVARWVSEETLLPSLVAPDGRRLDGLDSFLPNRVRALLSAR